VYAGHASAELLMAVQTMFTAVPPTRTLRDPLGSRTSTRNGSIAMPASIERRFFKEAVQRSGGNVSKAAEEVGMQRTNFHALLRKHGVNVQEAR
jgi:DNA-binding NtrC family response regulator